MEDITICTHGCDNENCEHTPVRMLGDGTEYRTEDLYGTEECEEYIYKSREDGTE